MSTEEIKVAINVAETRRHQAWQAGDTKTAADFAVQIDLLWDAWRHARSPHHIAEGRTRAKPPGYETGRMFGKWRKVRVP